jgi:hypothetical protein
VWVCVRVGACVSACVGKKLWVDGVRLCLEAIQAKQCHQGAHRIRRLDKSANSVTGRAASPFDIRFLAKRVRCTETALRMECVSERLRLFVCKSMEESVRMRRNRNGNDSQLAEVG